MNSTTASRFIAQSTRSFAVALVAVCALAPGVPCAAAPEGAPANDAAPASGAASLQDGEWNAIKAIISEQLEALRTGDGSKAFTYAAPGIRQQFGTPDNFLFMVRTAYGALIAARYSEFLEGAVIEGRVIQPLRLIGADNTVRVALYTMERQPDGGWKIAGCVLAPSTVQAA